MGNEASIINDHEAEVVKLIQDWAQAVRNRDLEKILAHHSTDLVMFDVPKPFMSVGRDAYRKTWDSFFAFTKPNVFDIQELHVVAGERVAFCFATMKCMNKNDLGVFTDLDFRLTIGLQKINNNWTIVHEHHSIPSE